MKKTSWIPLVCALVWSAMGSSQTVTKEELHLWPDIEPFHTDTLQVSDLHRMYYELSGNPAGTPVVVLHGGPGAGCSPYMRRFFNPAKFLIVLYDQRGAGKSTPYAEIGQNTTQELISDIEKLRKHLKLDKIILFGGSWGSALALAYAEAHPGNVRGMVLRGVFTATKEEIDHYYMGGVRTFFPEAYNRLLAVLPDPGKRPLPQYLFELIRTRDTLEGGKYSRAWARYEAKIGMLEISDETLDKMRATIPGADKKAYCLALVENYYMANGCFFEEGQIQRDLDTIADIPLVMVNGRYDMICPPVTAYRIHEKLPKSRLIIAEGAGHWMGEKPIENALLGAMREFEEVR
jgi:proline iminopeptidase